MRAPARLLGISVAVFIALTLILSRFHSSTITNTINRFPKIKEAYRARAAAVQSRLGAGSDTFPTFSSSSSCGPDSKSCAEPYTSKDGSTSKESEYTDQTSASSEYDKKQKDKDRRPSTKDNDRDADRGFTDAEQAAALERLEVKYGDEAKDKANPGRVLWMESTTTTEWGAERTEALDPEAEKARKILDEEYGDSKPTSTATDDDPDATPIEKGWRTTGFETKAKTAQKTLIDGGGGNGTATWTEFTTSTPTSTTTLAKGKQKAKGDATDKESLAKATGKSRWDDDYDEPPRKFKWYEDDVDDDDEDYPEPTKTRGRWDDEPAATSKKSRWDD